MKEEQVRQQNENTEISSAGIFSLNPEYKKRLHPDALKWFNARRAEIEFEVPLEELSDDDLNTFLSDGEKREFIKCKDEISKGLSACINIDDASPDPLTNVGIGLRLLTFEVNSLSPIYTIRLLLKKVYQRKAAKAKEERRKREEEERQQAEKVKEEQRKREEEERQQAEKVKEEQRRREAEERWWTAYKELNIPFDDAFKYLKPEEYEKFADSILGAVDAYLAKRRSYILDTRADDYLLWINVIKNRRKKEEKETAAAVKAREFSHFLNIEINKLKSTLSPNNISIKDHFVKQIGDPRYTGYTFTDLLSEEQKQNLETTLKKIVGGELNKLVSDEFRQFVYWRYHYSYYLLPSVDDYMYEGVPCLNFCFDTFAVIRAEIWIKPVEKEFGDYTCYLPVSEGNDSHVPLKAPQFIGYYYLILNPSDLGNYIFWQNIPLVLLKGLLSGETKPNGTTISAASDGAITYKIPKFKEEVNIPDNFASYLRSIGSIDEMVNMGIVTAKVASVAKSELGELKVEQQVLPSEGKTIRKDSKKAQAFQLFNAGKRPSDFEVKSLGIKPESAYRYYQDWKKTQDNSHNPT